MRGGVVGAVVTFLLALLPTAPAAAVTITFDPGQGFSSGDARAQINANPLLVAEGLSFTSYGDETGIVSGLVVTDDPNGGGNLVLRSGTHPDGADILLNSTRPVASLSVTYVDNPFATTFATLRAYQHNGSASDIVGTTVYTSASGYEPITLSVSGTGMYAFQFETGTSLIYIDSISITFEVPEPAFGALAIVSVVLTGWLGRRRRLA